jgi:hypothetical protein
MISLWGLQYRLGETGQNRIDSRHLADTLRTLDTTALPFRIAGDFVVSVDAESLASASTSAASLAEHIGNFDENALARAFRLLGNRRCQSSPIRVGRVEPINAFSQRSSFQAAPFRQQSAFVATSELSGRRITWISHQLDWIYPDDSLLWKLLLQAGTLDASPLLIARVIAPITFPLLKALGARGLQYYSLLTETRARKELREDADRLGYPHLLSLAQLKKHAVMRQYDRAISALTDLRSYRASPAVAAALADASARGFDQPPGPSFEDLVAWSRESPLTLPTGWQSALEDPNGGSPSRSKPMVSAESKRPTQQRSPLADVTDSAPKVDRDLEYAMETEVPAAYDPAGDTFLRVAAEVDHGTWETITRKKAQREKRKAATP